MEKTEERQRERMWLAGELATQGIRKERILESIRTVPRHLFVSSELADYAYLDRTLSIGLGQTISQPFIVALMIEAL